MELNEFAVFYQKICRFDEFLGLQLTVHEPGRISYQLKIKEQHLSMPGACHGGVIAAMMDAVLGLTALTKVFPEGKFCQTVEFKINYLSAVTPGTLLEGDGRVEFSGNRLVVTTAEIIDRTTRRPAAKGMGTFSLYPVDKKAHLFELLPKQKKSPASAEPNDPQLTP